MSTLLSYKDYLRQVIVDINQQIQKLMSTQSLPLWVNPVNSKFYKVNGYKVGDIVIAINDKQTVIEYLRPYINQIAEYVNMDISTLKERNNWEIDDDFYDIILYGGYILPQLKLQPLTVMSTNIRGFDIWMSTKGSIETDWNFDMPGMSSAWLNLRTQSSDVVELSLDTIIEKVEASNLMTEIYNRYLNNHLRDCHFGANNDWSAIEIDLNKYLDELELKHSSRINSTNDTLRMPVVQAGVGTIGQTLLIKSTTNDYIVASIIKVDQLSIDQPITLSFVPNENLDIVIPTLLEIDGEYIETNTNSIALPNDIHAYAINSKCTINNESLIYRSIGSTYERLSLSTTFGGFRDTNFNVVYTPIGKMERVDKTDIQCMPVEELHRSQNSITFKINPKYVWQTTALNICAVGIKSDASG